MTALVAMLAVLATEPEPAPDPHEECVTACLADDEDRAPLSEAECEALCAGDEP